VARNVRSQGLMRVQLSHATHLTRGLTAFDKKPCQTTHPHPLTQGANLENQTTTVECRYRCFSIAPQTNQEGYGDSELWLLQNSERRAEQAGMNTTLLTGGGRIGVAVPLPPESLPSE
jgi:hypothetical protein